MAILLTALSLAGCATSLNGKRDGASIASNLEQQEASIRGVPRQPKDGRVTVTGAVNKPGVYQCKGETLLQLMAIAGGFTDKASLIVVVVRQDSGRRSAVKFNVADIQTGRAQDPSIQAGDIIVAQTSVFEQGLGGALKVLPFARFRPF